MARIEITTSSLASYFEMLLKTTINHARRCVRVRDDPDLNDTVQDANTRANPTQFL